MTPTVVLFTYVILTIISAVVLILLFRFYLKNRGNSLNTHDLARLLLILAVFLLVDSLYNSLVLASQLRFLNPEIFFFLSKPSVQVVSKLGIFISTVFIVHFILGKKLENLRDSEIQLDELSQLNKELKQRAEELEKSQDMLQSKVEELERFNKIAKEREHKMIQLIKKIETLEKELEKG